MRYGSYVPVTAIDIAQFPDHGPVGDESRLTVSPARNVIGVRQAPRSPGTPYMTCFGASGCSFAFFFARPAVAWSARPCVSGALDPPAWCSTTPAQVRHALRIWRQIRSRERAPSRMPEAGRIFDRFVVSIFFGS